MIEHLVQKEGDPVLFEVRGVLEAQSEETLLAWRDGALSQISDLEKLVHTVNDVMDGNGFEGHIQRGEN